MREIKFRAWDVKIGAYVIPAHTMNIHTGQISDLPDRFLLEQFTGLHDKNGKEIYEGDVVLHDESDSGGDYEKFVVSFGKHHYDSGCYPFMGFGLDPIDAPDMDRHYRMFEQDEIEVIGNIHENPELLNAH